MNKKRNLLYIFSLNLILIIVFLKMLIDVIGNGAITRLDIWLNTKLQLLWNPLLNWIMTLITMIMDTKVVIALSIVLLVVLVSKKRFYHSFLLISSLIISQAVKHVIKLAIQRARPENALIHASGYSFPSGHATTAMIFFSLMIYFFKDDIKDKLLKNLFIAANALLILLIGFSRVYLGVHWFSDVIAGFSLGLFLLLSLILLSNIYKEKRLPFFG